MIIHYSTIQNKMSCTINWDVDPVDLEPPEERFELTDSQVEFLEMLEDLWYEQLDPVFDEPYGDFLTVIRDVLLRGYYNETEQYEIRDMIRVYLIDKKR